MVLPEGSTVQSEHRHAKVDARQPRFIAFLPRASGLSFSRTGVLDVASCSEVV